MIKLHILLTGQHQNTKTIQSILLIFFLLIISKGSILYWSVDHYAPFLVKVILETRQSTKTKFKKKLFYK